MKIYILYKTKNTPTGGGNQFLKAIRDYFIKIDCYAQDINESDIILYNSHQFVFELLKVKRKFPDKLFIHRIDGPMRLYNTMSDKRDLIVNIINKYIADGTIFQSSWSKEKNYYLGMQKNNYETTILNAPNPDIFNKDGKIEFNKNRKIKLIATSWSSNWKKGFETYKWLDENLDFDTYKFTFVGNSPVEFKNIIKKEPMDSNDLAKELKQHDIFITASQKDPCSNSLIEALHCGLPAIGLNDGGHTEIISNGGEVFDTKEEILEKLDKIVDNYEQYQKNITLPTLDEIGREYYNFLQTIYEEKENKNYKVKKFSFIDYLSVKKALFIWKLSNKIRGDL